MRQKPPENPFVDGEGFPAGQVVREVQAPPDSGRDVENGEVVSGSVCVLRNLPEKRRRISRITPAGSIQDLSPLLPYSLVREQRPFRGFRIHDALQNGRPRLRKSRSVFRKGPDTPTYPQLQTCVQLEGGVEVKRTIKPSKPVHPSLGIVARTNSESGQIFHVPESSLPPGHNEKPRRDSQTICVNIWQEFLFGKSVLDPYVQKQQQQDEEGVGATKFVRKYLEQYMSALLVDILMYTTYLVLYYASYCVCNMFCILQLGGYILLMHHLEIHERAYHNKLDVEFARSMFKGPVVAMTRNWCEHCSQRRRAKMVKNLMKKMKIDIIARQTRDKLAPT